MYIFLFLYDKAPFLLPRGCNDRIILIEFSRQMREVNLKFSRKHKAGGVKYPISLG